MPSKKSDNALSSRAMLASLKIGFWAARKLDKQTTEEVNQSKNADNDAGRYNKALLPKDAMAQVISVQAQTREAFKKLSSPWENDGTRILSAAGYIEFSKQFRELKDKYFAAVDEFIKKYPSYMQSAPSRLGALYDANDFPDAEELQKRFYFEISVYPMPDSDDFRVNMSAADSKAIKADIERRMNQVAKEAINSAWGRIREVTEHMAKALKDYNPTETTENGRKKTGFKESLVNNIAELADIIPLLNITGDKELDAMAEKMKKELCTMTAKELKESPEARKDTAKAAKAISDKIGSYLS